MAYNYERARDTAMRAITKYGSFGQLVKKGVAGGYDNDGNPTPSTPDVAIDGIITPLVKYTSKEVDGSSIIAGDSWVYFHSEDEPSIGMQATVNGVVFRVIDIHQLSSVDGTNIYRKLQLRS